MIPIQTHPKPKLNSRKLNKERVRARRENIPPFCLHFTSITLTHSHSLHFLSLPSQQPSMASIAPTCSPTSLQLRWAFNGPKFPVAQRLRLPNHLNPRLLRPLRAAAQTGNGSELSGSGSNAADGFSGWSESAEAEQPNTSKKKESYGGEYGS